ncbi:hypothetical protein AMELA_G00104310 [Ameiurus melas]|uniref:Uncharacterized protein n=1 Tax=Ameiurus melas TaxID=219545 RepID=A0A7J6AWI3_AMEME|nr:hypothetical protein AMELA_G00104310 [Ameiurus melas]
MSLLFSMGLLWWLTIISICSMFCNVNSSTDHTSVSEVTITPKGTTETNTHKVKNSETWILYISIFVPLTFVLLAAIIITVLVFIYRRKRRADFKRQETIYCGNSEVSHRGEHYVYKPTEKENDNYVPKPDLTPKEEPIYINVQVESSLEPSVEGDRTENIYCNVGCNAQQ